LHWHLFRFSTKRASLSEPNKTKHRQKGGAFFLLIIFFFCAIL